MSKQQNSTAQHVLIKQCVKEDITEQHADILEKVMGECQEVEIIEEIRYPLEHGWTLWYLETDHNKSWKDMLTEIISLDTIHDFWSLHYTIKPPSELKVGCDYSIFKRGIKPMWEDDANKKGGRWLFTVNKHLTGTLNKLWLDVSLMMIGELFEHADEICGAVVNVRVKNNKISVWTSNAENTEAVLEIGEKLKLLYNTHNHLYYQLHADAISKQGSVKSIYIL